MSAISSSLSLAVGVSSPSNNMFCKGVDDAIASYGQSAESVQILDQYGCVQMSFFSSMKTMVNM
eukprot:2364340-Karenia_brevis.AAC.1